MKTRFFFFVGLICLLGAVFFYTWQDATAGELVRVGVYDNKPKIYRDTDGTIKGFWANIINEIAIRENWDLEYVYGSWDEGLQRLKNNEIDIMVDVALSEDREQEYDFTTETALVNWGILYTRPDLEIESINDLEGKNIAVMKSGIHYIGPWGIKNMLESFQIKANYTDVSDYDDVFELLDAGKADAGVVNRIFGIANEADYNVVKTNIVFNPIELRFALTKNAPANSYLQPGIDNNLQDLKSDQDSVYYKSL